MKKKTFIHNNIFVDKNILFWTKFQLDLHDR